MHFAISRYRSHFAKFGLREGERDNQTFFERYARATFCRQLDKEGSKSREPERSDAVPYRLRTAPCFHSRSTFISNLASLWNARSLEPFYRRGYGISEEKKPKGKEETGEMNGREKETIFPRSSQPRNPVDPRISKRKGNRKVARNKARGEERASPCEIITFPEWTFPSLSIQIPTSLLNGLCSWLLRGIGPESILRHGEPLVFFPRTSVHRRSSVFH